MIRIRFSGRGNKFREIFGTHSIQNYGSAQDLYSLRMVHALINNFELRDEQMHGISEQVDWTGGHWTKYSLLD